MRSVVLPAALALAACPSPGAATPPLVETIPVVVRSARPPVESTVPAAVPAAASCRICGGDCPMATPEACREGLAKLCHQLADPIAANDVERFVALNPSIEIGAKSYAGEAVRGAAKEGARKLLGLDGDTELRVYLLRDCRACRRPYVTFVFSTGSASVHVWADMMGETASGVLFGANDASKWKRPPQLVAERHASCPTEFPRAFRYLGCSDEDRRELMASIWLEGGGDVPPTSASDANAAKARCIAAGPHRALNLTNWCCREP